MSTEWVLKRNDAIHFLSANGCSQRALAHLFGLKEKHVSTIITLARARKRKIHERYR